MGIYLGGWTIDEAKDTGAKHTVVCKGDRGYSNLTSGKEYDIEVTPRILSMSPLCKGIGDDGKGFECHLERFTKRETE